MSITYTKKTLDSLDDNSIIKPSSYEGAINFPLEKLRPREFELLTYFTIQQVIYHEGKWMDFSHIELLGGVRDNGMDCVFKEDGVNVGVIQCKHTSKNIALAKTILAKEILKFLLYALKTPSLLPNADKFKYLIFASSGLRKEAEELINDFNHLMPKEPKLKKWVNDVIIQHATLKSLGTYDDVYENLHNLLHEISVSRLPQEDFDLLLNKSYNTVVLRKFFTLRSVINPEIFREILDQRFSTSISLEAAEKYADLASFDLANLPPYFGSLSSTHIERPETTQLYNWVLGDLPTTKLGLAVLEANAGLGKTIVFRDLYHKLVEANIPVLAIKADRYYADNRMALEEKLFQKRGIEIENVLSILLQENHKIVVLIDQLDALSLTLSTQRDYLLTYNRLVTELIRQPGIRVVLSVRSFDLNYDADLRAYKSNKYHQVRLSSLPKTEVKKVLSSYEIKGYGEPLLDLLVIPNNLNTFCKISSLTTLKRNQLNSLRDLHQALWDDLMKITSEMNLQLKELLYEVGQAMFRQERITVPNIYKDSFTREIEFLASRNIIIEDVKGIQFFHQTFYDFVFAKQFVERGQSLLDYLQKKGQSLYVRQVVKMVLEYLREFNPEQYFKTLTKIVSSPKYRFHIKLLAIGTLAIQMEPFPKEKQIFKKYIFHNLTYLDAFLTSVQSHGWLQFLIVENVLWENLNPIKKWRHKIQSILPSRISQYPWLQKMLGKSYENEIELRRHLVLRILQNNSHQSLEIVIDFLYKLSGRDEFKGLVQSVLINIDRWENERLLSLFDEYIPYEDDYNTRHDNFWFYQILGEVVKHHLRFCLVKLSFIIQKLFSRKDYSIELGYDLDKFLKNMSEQYPKETFFFLFEMMKKIVDLNKIEDSNEKINTSLYKAKYFSDLNFVGSVRSNADEVLFDIMKDYLDSASKVDVDWTNKFYQENKTSDSIPVLKLCAIVLESNPSHFREEAFEFISIIHGKGGLNDWDNKFQYLLRKLIGSTFSFFSNKQISEIKKILFSIKHPTELSVYTDNDDKKHIVNSNGKKQYLFLLAIPESQLRKHRELWKRFQELCRKFKSLSIEPLNESRIRTYGVGGPLKPTAYPKMNFKNWKASMLKYGDDYKRDRYLDPTRGGKSEHAKAFKEQVVERPEYFYPLIVSLFEENLYAQEYLVYGIWGLVEGKFEPQKVLELFKLLIQKGIKEENIHMCTYFCQYFIQNSLMDVQVMTYLAHLFDTLPNPDKIYNPNDLEFESLNTKKSAVLIKIMQSSYNPDFKDIIYQTVDKAIQEASPIIHAALISHSVNLYKLDKNYAFKTFIAASETESTEVLKCSFYSAKYFLSEFFDAMETYFYKILEREELHENGIPLITIAYLLEYGENLESQRLMDLAFDAGEKSVCAILTTTEHYLFKDDKLQPNALKLLYRCLEIKGDDIASRFSGLILRKFKLENFSEVFSFLQSYMKSSHADKEPRYLLNYITQCSKQFPHECLDLMKDSLHIGHGDIQKRGFVDKEPVQAILAIYSALNMHPENQQKALNTTLDLFDYLLLNNRFRHHATEAVNQL